MASGIIKREANRYDAQYEHPWGGVASNADSSDIQPNQFVTGDGVFIKNGRILIAAWGRTTLYNYSLAADTGYWVGIRIKFVRLVKINNGNWITIALDEFGNAYYYDPTTSNFRLDQTLTAATMQSIDCIQVIGGVVYIFDFAAGASYVYTPQVSYVLGSAYVGGIYCMVLDNYLITLNTNQPTDAPPKKEIRYNWSAPFAYTTWDAGLDRTAGFNTLTSAQDQISGGFAMGNVGYILRGQGLSQLSPTGIGIQPFDETDVWESEFGIGCTFPDTFSQYGSLAIWGNNNNFYAFFSGNLPQSVTGACQAAIYADINEYENSHLATTKVSGAFSNTSENSQLPELMYVLAIISTGSAVPSGMQAKIWILNVESKTWTRQIYNLGTAMEAVAGFIGSILTVYAAKVIGLQEPNNTTAFLTSLPPRRIAANLLITVGTDAPVMDPTYSFLFALYYNETGITELTEPAIQIATSLKFRSEEIRLGTKPTVRGVIIRAAGSGTIAVTVNGAAFDSIIVNNSSPQTYKSAGMYTGEEPQLKLDTTNFDGYIVKANMNMTYDEGSPL